MNLVDLYEKSKHTKTLFRGDVREIKQFAMGKADPSAMVGRGIYLTTSHEVAQDYSIKGQQNIIFRSPEGTADEARSYISDDFFDKLQPHIIPLLRAYSWSIAGEMGRVKQLFQHDIDILIGTGKDAHRHHRYDELMNWKEQASDYAEAYAYKITEKMFEEVLNKVFKKHSKAYKNKFKNTMMMTTVLDELVVVPENDVGYISRFRIPKNYLDRAYRVDDPMESWLIKWIVRYIQQTMGYDPMRTTIDLRYNDPVEGEKRARNFKDWLKQFEQYGMRYAWGKHDVGGSGESPSLLEFVLGTHYGQSLQQKDDNAFWEALRRSLVKEGYVGFHYQGGNHTGTNTWTGGSPTKHDAYALWSEHDVKGFRISSKNANYEPTDPKLTNGIRISRLLKVYRQDIRKKQKPLKLRSKPENVNSIETAVNDWVNSGKLQQKMEKSINATS